MDWLKRLWHAREGSVIVMGALSLVSVLGMSGLAVEAGAGYVAKVTNQRVADVAALGAALAYKSSNSLAIAQQTARDIAVANGLTTTAVSTSQIKVGTADAIRVVVTTDVPIKLASVLTASPSYKVSDAAVASLQSGSGAGCITALGNSTTAISATGGASVVATGCGINTNGTIYSSNSSAKVTAKSIVAYAINQSYGGVTTTPTANNWTLQSNGASDFVKDNNVAVKAILCQVNKLAGTSDSSYSDGNTNCTNPVVAVTPITSGSTTDWTTGYNKKSPKGFDSYETADYSCIYNVPAGTYDIRNLTVTGGCSVTFASGSTLKFASIDMSGSDMSIGDGSLTVTGTFKVNGNNPVKVGNGTHYFGSLSIGGGKKLDVGSGNFTLYGTISLSGGAYLRVATAANDTVIIGSNGSTTAVSIGGGSQMCFTADCGAPAAAAGTFSSNGSISVDGGGSLFVFPKAATHVINGDFTATAGVIFGAGNYIIKGNFTNVTGDSASNAMTGTDITFALGGIFNFGGGAYYDLAAPTAASAYGIPDVLLVTKSSAATTISAGANGKVSGLVYAPNSALSSSGGSSISSRGSSCMMVVVQSVTVTGSGTVNTANCTSVASWAGGATTVALIQ